MFLLPLVIT